MPTKSVNAKQYLDMMGLAPHKPPVPKREPKTKAKFDSGWESDYEQQLRIMKRGGVIQDYVHCVKKGGAHTLTISSPDVTIKYTPDFSVITSTGGIIKVEVKGRCANGREDRAGILNFKHFSIQYPQFRFIMVTKEDGAWKTMFDYNKQSAKLSGGGE